MVSNGYVATYQTTPPCAWGDRRTTRLNRAKVYRSCTTGSSRAAETPAPASIAAMSAYTFGVSLPAAAGSGAAGAGALLGRAETHVGEARHEERGALTATLARERGGVASCSPQSMPKTGLRHQCHQLTYLALTHAQAAATQRTLTAHWLPDAAVGPTGRQHRRSCAS